MNNIQKEYNKRNGLPVAGDESGNEDGINSGSTEGAVGIVNQENSNDVADSENKMGIAITDNDDDQFLQIVTGSGLDSGKVSSVVFKENIAFAHNVSHFSSSSNDFNVNFSPVFNIEIFNW